MDKKETKKTDKPDIIFLTVDQLSQKWIEAAFAGTVPMPNLQRLREQGTSFTQAFCSNPVCSPSRATLATGLTTRGHGVLENGYELDPELPNFMQMLQKNGWRTGAFGKLHLQPHFKGFDLNYNQYGFDVTHITEDGRGGEWLDWVEENHPEHYENVLATIWATKIPAFEKYGRNQVNLRERIEKIRADYEWKTANHPGSTPMSYVLPFPKELSQTEWITGKALDYITETDQSHPLFAHISYVQPHGPFCPPAGYLERVNPDMIPEPAFPEWLEDPAAPDCLKNQKPFAGDWRDYRPYYFADLHHLDEQFGKILAALENRGNLDNTYIIFLSDHGELFGDHGFRGKEEKHYDACIRVPLVICGPGLQKGQIVHSIVQHEDICPTILEMAGVDMPPMPKLGHYLGVRPEDIPKLPGNSLMGYCRGETAEPARRCAYIESYNPISGASPRQWARTIRTGQYRYTYYPRGGGEQLFDLENDPDEQVNLAKNPEWTDIKRQLKDQLMEEIILQDYPKTRRSLFALGVH